MDWIKTEQTKLLRMKRKFILRCLIFLHGLDQNRTNKITMDEEKIYIKMLDLSSWIGSKQKKTNLL